MQTSPENTMTSSRIPAPDRMQIAAALSTPDVAISYPTRHRTGTLTAAVVALEPGECASKAVPMDMSMTLYNYTEGAVAQRELLRNSVKSSVRQAAGRTGGKYEVEVSDMLTLASKLYVIAIITRVE